METFFVLHVTWPYVEFCFANHIMLMIPAARVLIRTTKELRMLIFISICKLF